MWHTLVISAAIGVAVAIAFVSLLVGIVRRWNSVTGEASRDRSIVRLKSD
jgi:hypothetical protein